jgi:hypothetical protein
LKLLVTSFANARLPILAFWFPVALCVDAGKPFDLCSLGVLTA